MTRPLQ